MWTSVIVLALAVGLACGANTKLAVGGFLGALIVGAFYVTWRRDPILALELVWFSAVFRQPVAAALGWQSSAASAVRELTDLLVVVTALDLLLRSVFRARPRIRKPRVAELTLAGVGLVGLVSSLRAHAGWGVTGLGAWDALKIWTLLAVSMNVVWRERDYARVYRFVTYGGAVVALLGVLDFASGGAVASALHTRVFNAVESYRSSATQSILSSEGEYDLLMTLLVAMTAAQYVVRRRRQDLWLLLLFVVGSLVSLRLKGAVALPVIFAVVLFVKTPEGRMRGRLRIAALTVVVVVAGLAFEGNIIKQQIITYTQSPASARAQLYSGSVRIARANFPLGVGFGRFGSDPSRRTYSPVYYQYGLSSVWGLSPAAPQFITDTEWPSLLGETGVAGTVLFALGLLVLAGVLYRRARRGTSIQATAALAGLCAMAGMIVDSAGDSTFALWIAATTFALIVGPVFSEAPARERSESSAEFGVESAVLPELGPSLARVRRS